MVKRFNDHSSQLEAESAVALTNEAKLSLYKKSQKSGISTDILEEVYRRGFNTWSEKFSGTPEQFAFDRVNSFIAGGFAEMLDEDLKKACWKGYEAIGMKMKNGKKVPNCVPVKEEDAEAHSKDFTKPSSRFIGSDELVTVYKTQTPGQIIKRVVRECLEEGDVIRTKFATKNLQKRGIEGPHPIEGKDIYRLWATSKVAPDDAEIAYHGHNARIIHKGKHTDIKHGSVSAGYAGDLKASVIRKQAPKKSGNVVKIKEAAIDAAHGAAPQAQGLTSTTRLGRNAPTTIQSRIAPQGLNKVGQNRYRASSETNLSGKRMTSGSTQATAKTLTPQRVSANQPAPKTASAPSSAPKPTASFGSSSKPTTVRATSGGMEKSGGYKLSSGMSDAGKVKVKPEAPAEVMGAVAKRGLGKALGAAVKGTVAGAAMDVAAQELSKKAQASYKAGHQSFTPHGAEGEKASTVFSRMKEPSQGRSVSNYEKDVLTPKTYEKPANPKVDAPTPPSRPDYFTRGQAFQAARSEVGGSGGKFSYGGKDYQTNVAGEKYVAKPTTTSVKGETESGKAIKKIKEAIEEATYQGKKVPLNKPMKGDVKKSKVFVDPDGDGKAKKVNFGDKSLSIKKHIPARKKSYCARSGGQGNLTDKSSANYWSRRAWNCEETEVNELSVPAGTTGKRENVSTPSVAIRMASGKIEKHPPGKSGSSGGGDE